MEDPSMEAGKDQGASAIRIGVAHLEYGVSVDVCAGPGGTVVPWAGVPQGCRWPEGKEVQVTFEGCEGNGIWMPSATCSVVAGPSPPGATVVDGFGPGMVERAFRAWLGWRNACAGILRRAFLPRREE